MSKKAREPMEPKLSAKKKKNTHALPRDFSGKYGLLSGSKKGSVKGR
jgi:hypothetical protein